jgi:hypothetical protein
VFLKQGLKLSAVKKVLETIVFLELGSFETLGSKLSHGTSWIAEIIHRIISPNFRSHIRKVYKNTYYYSVIRSLPKNSCKIKKTMRLAIVSPKKEELFTIRE